MTRQPKSGSPRFTHDDCVRIAGKSHFLSFSEHGAFRFVGLGLDCQLRIRPCCTKLCHKSRGIESRKVLLLLRGYVVAIRHFWADIGCLYSSTNQPLLPVSWDCSEMHLSFPYLSPLLSFVGRNFFEEAACHIPFGVIWPSRSSAVT